MLAVVETKTCRACREDKPLDAFYTRPNAAGVQVPRGTCKACQSVADKAAREADPERFREYQRANRAKSSRRARKLREYGLTEEDFDRMLEEQGDVCAICDGPPQDYWHLDHDHSNGEARAILCGLCNRMLGMARDNAEILRAGAAYLDAHSERLLKVV